MVEILNLPRPHKRALRITPDGQINLRKRIIDLLQLQKGDGVIFCIDDRKQMFVYKDNDDPRSLRLKGRKGQLTAYSAATARILVASVENLPREDRNKPVELVAFNATAMLSVEDKKFKAVKIINRV